MSRLDLHISIAYMKGVGASKANLLAAELGIHKVGDLFGMFPFRYIDKTRFYKISELQPNSSEVQLKGKITRIRTLKQKRGTRLSATFEDASGQMELVWFRGAKWLKESLKVDIPYVIFGKVNFYKGSVSMPHPDMELFSAYEKSIQTAMQPVYTSTEKLANKGISQKVFSNLMKNLFASHYPAIRETLSASLMSAVDLLPKKEALFNIHFPKSQALLAKAQYRLKFEEFFFMQLQLLQKKANRHQKIKGYPFASIGDHFNNFYSRHLPFDLTGAQKRVLKEIRKDLGSGVHMNRLLQGDVGSGKTIVALLSMLIALDNGFQAALIAPTEILAVQHHASISEALSGMELKVSLLTGSVKAKDRKVIHEDLMSGELHILIGTHALLEDKVTFQNLGLAVIDEQHRFGVAQRSKMWLKNELPPHVLVMTATPIPRTLAMSVYGDLDVSVIDELPPGRKSVQTVHRYDKNRLAVFKFMKNEIAKGRQVYVVYPLIQESEAMDYKDLMDGYESISRAFPKPTYQLSIVHGKMSAVDKKFEMDRFVKGETNIMVATTVIEVGVNVPNASVMVVESAERFGLSQLHQLRGRVGRGADQSYCVLMTGFQLSAQAKTRMATMVNTTDGFEIAEVDLKLRGPGNLLGTQQSGVLNTKIADVVKDQELLKLARAAAIQLLEEDPLLQLALNANIADTFREITKNNGMWSNIS